MPPSRIERATRNLYHSDEQANGLISKGLKFHEEVYLPAEAKMEKELGRKLNYGEMMSLTLHLQFDK